MKGKRRCRAALLALAFLLTGCGTPAPSPGKEAPSAAPAAGESYQAPPLALAEFDEAAAFGESGSCSACVKAGCAAGKICGKKVNSRLL